MANGQRSGRREIRLMWLLLAIGAGLRAAFLYLHAFEPSGGEAFQVAASFARTGTLANPYLGPTGPTAHVLPIPVVIAGTVYALLGVASRPAEYALSCWSVGLALAAFGMTFITFRRAGASPAAGLAGLALCCCLPLNFGLETVTFRVWEGGLAVALTAGLLLAVVTLDRAPTFPTTRSTIRLALLLAVLFLVSPQLGLAGYAATALLFFRRVPARRWAAAIGIAALACGLVLGPWLVRNDRLFGSPLLRSNLGLELAIAFHPGAVDPPDTREAFLRRVRQVHPAIGTGAFRALRAAGGEVPYARRLGAETRAWIATHPSAAVGLAITHLRQFLFPPAWSFRGADPAADRAVALKAAISWLVTSLGLIGTARRLIPAWRSAFTYVATTIVIAALPYLLVQPTTRYSYVIFVPLAFFAADLAVWAVSRVPGMRELVDRFDRLLAPSQAGSVTP